MKLASKRRSSPTDYIAIAVRSGIIAVVLLLPLVFLHASAPVDPSQALPDVETRFEDWVRAHNAVAISDLPGNTPEPGSPEALLLAQAEQPAEGEAQSMPQQTVQPYAEPTPEPQEVRYPSYAAGELAHETDTLKVGIEQYSDGKITYYVADILIKDPTQFGYAFSYDTFKGARESVSDIADRNEAVLAINGDFCGFHTEGVIIRGFELFRKQNSKRHLMIVDKNGDMSALTDRREKQGTVANRLMDQGVMHTFEFGPLLVKDGEAVELPRSFFIRAQDGYFEPRTAIGQLGPLHYIIIVVDGRQPGYSEGATIPRMQELFLEHGAQFAFNLDGGGSTTLYFNGKIINHPSSGDERRVSDIVMFKD